MGRCKMKGKSLFTSSNSCGSVRTLIPQGFHPQSLSHEAGRTFSLSWLGWTAEEWVHILHFRSSGMTSNKLSIHTDLPEHLLFSAPWKRRHKLLVKIQREGRITDSPILWSLTSCVSPLWTVPPVPHHLSASVSSWKGLELCYFAFLTVFSSASPAFQLAGFTGSWLCFRREGWCHHSLMLSPQSDVVTTWASRPVFTLRASSSRKEFSVRAHKQMWSKEENKKRTVAPILLSSKGYLDLS